MILYRNNQIRILFLKHIGEIYFVMGNTDAKKKGF